MNERIKEAAFQAGFINKLVSDGSYFLNNPKLEAKLKKFSDLIRADEREACAKVCENEAKEHDRNTYDARDGRYDWQADGANACAAAIRARENT